MLAGASSITVDGVCVCLHDNMIFVCVCTDGCRPTEIYGRTGFVLIAREWREPTPAPVVCMWWDGMVCVYYGPRAGQLWTHAKHQGATLNTSLWAGEQRDSLEHTCTSRRAMWLDYSTHTHTYIHMYRDARVSERTNAPHTYIHTWMDVPQSHRTEKSLEGWQERTSK